ncbi:hypothetical protein ACJIZ3_023590 [Penstemon smallii]|uniref:Pre-mRNA-splicing factor SLU7 n=2 Tax=Penstemon smallii TaxID=265156 RepID=A0ABD3TPH5_9LAMI
MHPGSELSLPGLKLGPSMSSGTPHHILLHDFLIITCFVYVHTSEWHVMLQFFIFHTLPYHRPIYESSYAVSAILSSYYLVTTSRSANLQELLQGNDHYSVYKFNPSYCTGAAGIEAAEAASDLMRANIARKEASEEAPSQAEEKRLATWGSEVPDDLVIDQKKLAEALQKEDERRREERDERKRKYNVKWNDEVTPEDMEAFRMKRIHHDDPMKEFLH